MSDDIFRVSIQAVPTGDGRTWTDLARRVEDLGFYALYVADHVGVTADPFAALAAAAAVTSTLRLGTYVLNAAVRDPLSVAMGAATVDLLSDGRMILGIGAGHTPAEWTMRGRPYPSAGERVRHLCEVVDDVRGLLRGDVVTSAHTNEAMLVSPRPVQNEIPLLIGGNGTRVLECAGRHATIVGMSGAGRTLEDGHRHEVRWSPDAIDERVEIVRSVARARARPPVLDALVQHFEITDERDRVAEGIASRVAGLEPADALAAPYVLFGTLDQLVEEIAAHRERWGFNSYVIRADALEAAAALVARSG